MAASPEETYKHLFLKCDHSICRPVEEKYNISAQNLRTKALELYFFPWQGSDLEITPLEPRTAASMFSLKVHVCHHFYNL